MIHVRGDAKGETKDYVQNFKRTAKTEQKLEVRVKSDHENLSPSS